MKKIILTITTIFICTIAYAHTINWHVGNTILETTTCESGDNITPPTVPSKFGYHFKEWVEYTPIEYLENTGPQRIDTGYYPNQNTSIKAKFKILNSSSSWFFGTGTGGYFNNSFLSGTYDNKTRFFFGGFTSGTNAVNTVNNGDVIEFNWNKRTLNYLINNIAKNTIYFEYKTFSAENTLWLLNLNLPGYSNTSQVRLYYFQLYDNDILIRDFIPVLDKNGVPCMYDKVERKFYYNAGTGQFIAGPVIWE